MPLKRKGTLLPGRDGYLIILLSFASKLLVVEEVGEKRLSGWALQLGRLSGSLTFSRPISERCFESKLLCL